jgi:hypothetical protein
MKVKATKPPARATKTALPARLDALAGRVDEAALLGDLRALVQAARQRIATAAYSTQTLLCWHMGRRLAKNTCKAAGPRTANRFS